MNPFLAVSGAGSHHGRLPIGGRHGLHGHCGYTSQVHWPTLHLPNNWTTRAVPVQVRGRVCRKTMVDMYTVST